MERRSANMKKQEQRNCSKQTRTHEEQKKEARGSLYTILLTTRTSYVYSSYACFGYFNCLHVVASHLFRHTLPLSKSIPSHVPTLADLYSICLLIFCAHLGRFDVTLDCLHSPDRFTSFSVFAYCLRLASGVHSSGWFAC